MSDEAEKQFDATPARLAKARREGQTARSSELGASLAMLAALGSVAAVAGPIAHSAREALIEAAAGARPWGACIVLFAYAVIPLVSAATCGALAGAMQTGGVQFNAPRLKLERLDPFAGCKRLWSRETMWQAVRAFAAFVCACAVTLAVARGIAIAALSGAPPAIVGNAAYQAAQHAIVAVGVVGACFGAVEFVAARKALLQRLRMTFDEYKRELKEQDGDPQIRGRRRSLHRALARGDVRRLKDAAFVICNPTHVAVALAYAPPDEPVPRVLVRAADDLALQVRRIAAEHGIPAIENVTLARALYADARAGETIPHAHYVAVAEVVAALMRSGALQR